jgi:hypothetical protein
VPSPDRGRRRVPPAVRLGCIAAIIAAFAVIAALGSHLPVWASIASGALVATLVALLPVPLVVAFGRLTPLTGSSGPPPLVPRADWAFIVAAAIVTAVCAVIWELFGPRN